MTSHLNSHRTTDIKPEMLSGVQTGNGTPHDKYNVRGAGHIPGIFSLHAAYSALRHFYLDIKQLVLTLKQLNLVLNSAQITPDEKSQ